MYSKQHTNNEDVSGGVSVKTWAIRAVVIIVLAAAVYFAATRAVYSFGHESTDDAFIEGTIVPVSSEVKGKVVKVLVGDNQVVKAGDPLVEIAADDYANAVRSRQETVGRISAEQEETRAAVKMKKMALVRAHAELEAAQTDAAFAEKELKRSTDLRGKEVISQSQFDQAESRAKAMAARRESAEASVAEIEAAIDALNAELKTQSYKSKEAGTSLDLARLDLKRTIVAAPIDGRIAKKSVDEGKYVVPGQPLLAVVDDHNLWVQANFKETQIAAMKPGQPVDITVDAYPGVRLAGHVESFQPGTGAVFSLLPPQNATGNFVKVVQRVPVKIVIDSKPDAGHPLWPGLSVSPAVAIKAAPQRERIAGNGNVEVR